MGASGMDKFTFLIADVHKMCCLREFELILLEFIIKQIES